MNHSEGVQHLAEHHRRNGAKVIVIEPGRPRNWYDLWPWDSPDVVAWYDIHRVIADDFKREAGDLRAQLDKRQVKEPRFAVGSHRSIVVTRGLYESLSGSVMLPNPRWGLSVMENDGGVCEISPPEEQSERSYKAHEAILFRALLSTEPAAPLSDMQKERNLSLQAAIEEVVERTGPVTLKEVRQITGSGLADATRAIRKSSRILSTGSPATLRWNATTERPT